MHSHRKIDEYIGLLCNQVRWKKAQAPIAAEMRSHIIDQRDALIAEGLGEDEATARAIAETGDAAQIGMELDRAHRPRTQWGMLCVMAALLAMGFVIQLLLFDPPEYGGLWENRVIALGLGVAVMGFVYFLDFTWFGKYAPILFVVLVMGIGGGTMFARNINGARQFVNIGFFPLSLTAVSLLLPLMLAGLVFRARGKGLYGLAICGGALVAGGVSISMVYSMPALAHYAAAGLCILLVAQWRGWFGVKRVRGFLLILVPAVICVAGFLLTASRYHSARIEASFFPERFEDTHGFVTLMTRELVSGAKLFGQGNVPEIYANVLANARGAFAFDQVLTTVLVRWGWAAFVGLVCVLGWFIVRGFRLCFKQKSSLGLYLSMACMLTFAAQFAAYVVWNLGFQLITPLSLPFVSYGNSAIVMNLVLAGVALSVFRTGDIVRDKVTGQRDGEGKEPFYVALCRRIVGRYEGR